MLGTVLQLWRLSLERYEAHPQSTPVLCHVTRSNQLVAVLCQAAWPPLELTLN